MRHVSKKMFFLSSSLFDLFTAGMETLSTSIQMTVLQMLHHPEVQERVHREIDEVSRKNFKRLTQLIAQWPTNFSVKHFMRKEKGNDIDKLENQLLN